VATDALPRDDGLTLELFELPSENESMDKMLQALQSPQTAEPIGDFFIYIADLTDVNSQDTLAAIHRKIRGPCWIISPLNAAKLSRLKLIQTAIFRLFCSA
jgi:hypothetical protein